MDVKLLIATLPDEENLAAWCRRLGISRQTAYKWRARYRAEGPAGLEERSRSPLHPPGRTPGDVEDLVVRLRKELADGGWDAGPATIRWHLERRGHAAPSESTIWRILVRRGQVVPEPKKRPRSSWQRFVRDRPNECWQIDATKTVLVDGTVVEIVNIVDDHSRLNIDSLAVATCTSEAAWTTFARGAQRHGTPAELLSDNGRAFTSARNEKPVLFEVRLAALGVRQLRSAPYHPQTCGKIERFHGTQALWLDDHPAEDLDELQQLLDEFRHGYNTNRPHGSLGRRTPQQAWDATEAASPPTRALEAPPTIRLGRVQAGGKLCVSTRLTVGIGVAHAHTEVLVLRRGDALTIVDACTSEVLRELTIDPTRDYQPSGRRRGGPRQTRPQDPT
jgi:transposase InsO family protein